MKFFNYFWIIALLFSFGFIDANGKNQTKQVNANDESELKSIIAIIKKYKEEIRLSAEAMPLPPKEGKYLYEFVLKIIKNDDINTLNRLCEEGLLDINAINPTSQNDSLLTLAIDSDKPDMVKFLLNKWHKILLPDYEYYKNLEHALNQAKPNVEIIKELLKYKDITIDFPTLDYRMLLIVSKNPEIFKLLLDHGNFDINLRYGSADETLLHDLVQNHAPLESVDLLIKYGADINAKSFSKKTVLDIAQKYNKDPQIISRLKKADKKSILKFRSTEIVEELMDLSPKAPKFKSLLDELKKELTSGMNRFEGRRNARVNSLLDIINEKMKADSSTNQEAATEIINFLNTEKTEQKTDFFGNPISGKLAGNKNIVLKNNEYKLEEQKEVEMRKEEQEKLNVQEEEARQRRAESFEHRR